MLMATNNNRTSFQAEYKPNVSTWRNENELGTIKAVCSRLFEKIAVIENILLQQFGSEVVARGEAILELLEDNQTLLPRSSRFSKSFQLYHQFSGNERVAKVSKTKIEEKHQTDETRLVLGYTPLENERAYDNYDIGCSRMDGDDSDIDTGGDEAAAVVKKEPCELPERKAPPFPQGLKDETRFPRNCVRCGVLLQNRQAFRTHDMLHKLDGHFKCDLCDKVFRTEFSKKAHMKSHSKSDSFSFSCPKCDDKFATRCSLAFHERYRHATAETYPYVCHICQKRFKTNPKLQEHIRFHQKLKRFSCPVEECEHKFYTSTHARRHLQGVHAWKIEDIPASIEMDPEFIVPKPIPKPKIPRKRPRTGYKLKRVVCYVCGKNILQAGLNAHMRLHDGPVKCEYCGQGFQTDWSLDLHTKRAHTAVDLYTFECSHPDCGRRFKSTTALRDHFITHNETPNYRCIPCGKGYKQRAGLDGHKKRHHPGENSKRYICRFCQGEKYFLQRSELTKHLRGVHKMSEYEARDEASIVTEEVIQETIAWDMLE